MESDIIYIELNFTNMQHIPTYTDLIRRSIIEPIFHSATVNPNNQSSLYKSYVGKYNRAYM